MKASRHLLVVCSFLTIFATASAQDMNTSVLQQSVTNLLIEAQKQGLVPSKYAKSEAALTGLINGGRVPEALKQAADLITRISYDFASGQVKADQLKRNYMVPTKKITASQTAAISQYVNGQITAADLIQVMQPKNEYYNSLVSLLQRFQQAVDSGQLVTAPAKLNTVKAGAKDTASILYARARLALLGYDNDQTNPAVTSDLTESIIEFQADHNLTADGALGAASWSVLDQDVRAVITKIRLNIDRTRWLPDSLGANHVFVNLAEQQLKLVLNSQVSMNFKTINGRLDRQTPILFDSMSHLQLNPTWTVPQSILFKDKLPLILQNPGKVLDMNMKVIDDVTGTVVDPYSVDWTQVNETFSPYTLVQSPGPHNALGFVKFPLTNPYAIYLHDTDSRHLFANADRLLSSGCVRLEKPFEFAAQILNNVQWTAESLRAASEFLVPTATASTRVKFGRSIPVYLFYLTTSVNANGKIVFSKDSYKIDSEMYGMFAR